jgi:hypothetical protein
MPFCSVRFVITLKKKKKKKKKEGGREHSTAEQSRGSKYTIVHECGLSVSGSVK